MEVQAVMHIDGGSRGNPGPAGAGVVIYSADDRTELYEAGFFLGEKTNNLAEYTALLEGLKALLDRNINRVEIFSDSQLMVRQISGEYRVKNAGLKPLFQEACGLIKKFQYCKIEHVRREKNKDADKLANMAMDAKANIGDAT